MSNTRDLIAPATSDVMPAAVELAEMSMSASMYRSCVKYTLFSRFPSITGFWPTDWRKTQLPSVSDGMSLSLASRCSGSEMNLHHGPSVSDGMSSSLASRCSGSEMNLHYEHFLCLPALLHSKRPWPLCTANVLLSRVHASWCDLSSISTVSSAPEVGGGGCMVGRQQERTWQGRAQTASARRRRHRR